MDRDSLLSRLTGLLYGLVIGDALAKPTTGLPPYQVMCRYQIMDAFYPDGKDSPGKNSLVAKNALLILKYLFDHGELKEEIKNNLTHIEIDNDPCFLPRIAPLAGFLSFSPLDDLLILKECKTLVLFTQKDKSLVLPAFAIAKIIIDCIRNRKSLDNPSDLFQKDMSLMSRTIINIQNYEKALNPKPNFLFSDRLIFTRKKLQAKASIEEFLGLNGNTDTAECVAFSIFCFMKAPDSFNTITTAASMGGSSCVNASLTGALVGSYSGSMCFPEDLRSNVENSSKIPLWADNLIDKFFKEE